MNLLQRIQQRIQYLPEKDIKYAEKFIKNRDFQSLFEIVDSDVKKINNSLDSENPKEEYLKINIEALEELRYDILEYKTPLEGDIDYFNDEYFEV